ncbi:MAG TPA: hypothetical protein VFR46_09840, partial [Actinomycetes bacterium]|nr:hypothetical protein [Actinomycetes bacterium]
MPILPTDAERTAPLPLLVRAPQGAIGVHAQLAADVDALRQRLRSDKRINSLTITPTLDPA